MSEKPILFNTEMVKAIIEGRKTVTRRIIRNVKDKDFIGFVTCSTIKEYEGKVGFGKGSFEDIANANIDKYIRPPYRGGDILYVRETWKKYTKRIGKDKDCRIAEFYGYKADEGRKGIPSEFYEGNWKPSIHMPKEAARIFLRVTNVSVERLQHISDKEALREGIREYTKDGSVIKYALNESQYCWQDMPRNPIEPFVELWDSTVKKGDIENYSYKSNPWIWVIEFEVVTEDFETGEYIKVFE